MDYEKAKRALDALTQECQAQQDRLQHAVQAKQTLDDSIRIHRQIISAKERFSTNQF